MLQGKRGPNKTLKYATALKKKAQDECKHAGTGEIGEITAKAAAIDTTRKSVQDNRLGSGPSYTTQHKTHNHIETKHNPSDRFMRGGS